LLYTVGMINAVVHQLH